MRHHVSCSCSVDFICSAYSAKWAWRQLLRVDELTLPCKPLGISWHHAAEQMALLHAFIMKLFGNVWCGWWLVEFLSCSFSTFHIFQGPSLFSAKELLLFSLLGIPFFQFSHAKAISGMIAVSPRDLEKQLVHPMGCEVLWYKPTNSHKKRHTNSTQYLRNGLWLTPLLLCRSHCWRLMLFPACNNQWSLEIC